LQVAPYTAGLIALCLAAAACVRAARKVSACRELDGAYFAAARHRGWAAADFFRSAVIV